MTKTIATAVLWIFFFQFCLPVLLATEPCRGKPACVGFQAALGRYRLSAHAQTPDIVPAPRKKPVRSPAGQNDGSPAKKKEQPAATIGKSKGFRPSEKIKADTAVSFPADI